MKKENEEVKKLEEENEKKRLIFALKRLQNKKEKLIQEKKNIKKLKFKTKSKSIPKPKFKLKSKTKSKSKPKSKPKSKQKQKSFQDYYQECIEGKDIPKDAPEYLKKALLKAKKEYEKGILLIKSGLKGFAEKYVIKSSSAILPKDFFREKASKIIDFLRNHRNIKVRMLLVCLMERKIIVRSKGKTKIIYEPNNAYFQSRTYVNLEKTDVKVFLKKMIKEILATLDNYQQNGSGWYFEKMNELEIHIVDYKPMKGGSYIPLPEFVKKKNAIINIENKDDKCFLWCVLRYLHPVLNHGERISDLKKYENDLNFKQINFPVQVKDITKFENYNSHLPGINVYSVNDNNKVYPLRVNQKDCRKSIDLFLYSDGVKQHYSFVKNFSRLVRSQITSHRSSKIFICKKCLYHYNKEDLLEKHILYCGNSETVLVKMPTKKHNIC